MAGKIRRKTPTKAGARKASGMRKAPARKRPAKQTRCAPAGRSANIDVVVRGLAEAYPNATCELHHENAYQLLVATILSAQCTDERVNQVTPALFARYPTPVDLATADPGEVEELVRSTGFFRNKTRNIIGMAQGLVADHGGEVPRTLEALTALRGVARKTANVVLGTVFGIPSGIVVDTHVKRIAGLLGLTRNTDPVKIERDLMAQLPEDTWIDFGHRMIHHGRKICIARRPRCDVCVLRDTCPSAPSRAKRG